jgi:hypothetical protein
MVLWARLKVPDVATREDTGQMSERANRGAPMKNAEAKVPTKPYEPTTQARRPAMH